ncbi:MAG: F0F1 ATP synthase subunit B [Fimbriimonadaceae bacterium]
MSTAKSSPGGAVIGIVAGLVLAVLGSQMAVKQTPEAVYGFTHKLAESGVPLDLGKTLATLGVFLILFPVVKIFFVQPLGDAINGRAAELESTFSEAESLRADMTTLKSGYEKRLAETEANAREQIQTEIRKAQDLRAQLEADARSKADDYLKKAQAEIDSEKNRVITDLRIHVVDLTMGATEKILGENVDNDRNRKLVNEFIDKIEVPA